MKKYLIAVVATLFAASSLASQGGLPEADQKKVVCVPKRTVDGAIAEGQVCKTGAQWRVALRAEKRQATATSFVYEAERGTYLARRPLQQFAPKASAKPY
jgi:hypothetical protein